MKKLAAKIDRVISYAFLAVCLLFIAGVVVYTYDSLQDLSGRIESELGNKAMLVAMSIAQQQDISHEEFERLAALEFTELLEDPVNVQFENRTREIMGKSDIKYIYIEAPITEGQVKYRVQEGEEEIYCMPAGTPLDVIFLLDAVVSHEARIEDTDGQWYSDKDRYTVRDEKFQATFQSGEAGYYVNTDQWGTYITGYAPCINERGECLGLVGVDLFMDNYLLTLDQSRRLIVTLLLSSLLMAILAVYLAIKLKYAENLAEQKTILAQTDSLTELYNRRHFMEQLEIEWRSCNAENKPISIIMVDVDYLKEYNDNYGHLEGDRVLRHVAAAIAGAIDGTGGFVGRYGGDEFIVSLPALKPEDALEIANRISAFVSRDFGSGEIPFPTVSIGVATVQAGEELRSEDLISRADQILYRAKGQGRNRVCG